MYIVPTQVGSRDRSSRQGQLLALLKKYGYSLTQDELDKLFSQQTHKYVKLFSSANPQVAQDIKELKVLYNKERSKDKVPVLHGVILEPYHIRYYPQGELMSNVLGYVDKNGDAYYGVEKYFDDALRGIDGKINGRASSFLGSVGGNDFEVINGKDGDDIFLSIDVGIQKEVETIVKRYLAEFRADAISVMVYDPNNGQVKASVNAPSFNPNDYNDAYILKPL